LAHYSSHKQFGGGLIKGIPFFDSLTADEAETVEHLVVKKHFCRGEVVLIEEDTSRYMYIIVSGKVRVVQLSTEGKERILAIHKRGDHFGELALFDGKTAPATVIAMEESVIGLLSKSDFDLLVRKNEKILFHFLTALCMKLRESWMMLKLLSFADAEERIRSVLENMSRLYGVKDQRGVLVSLKLTHKDIANYASVSRETVTRLMNRLSRDGEIEILDNRCILLKPTFSNKHHFL
jgi:CRP/FNR family transcriptional regulator, cyclic AMP receptor protein